MVKIQFVESSQNDVHLFMKNMIGEIYKKHMEKIGLAEKCGAWTEATGRMLEC